MNEHKYNKELEENLLVAIYHKYVKDHGDQPSQLDVYHFDLFHDISLYDSIPEILSDPIRNNRANPWHIYFTNLKHSKCINEIKSPLNSDFVLTEKGYERAKRIINPIKYLIIDNKKSTIAIIVALIIAIIKSS